jgi:glycosyltransferase involved in cell wall biosynthesis
MTSLFYHLKRGKLTFIGKPIFMGLVLVELLLERCLNMLFSPQFKTKDVNTYLTAIIKTFERPKELRRLIKSIRYFYPDMKIIVVDDSQNPSILQNVEVVSMPYDSGVSAGRNVALDLVKTKYFLLLDDDFVFYRKTDLEPFVKKMHKNIKIDILGGKVVNLPLYTSTKYKQASLYANNKNSIMISGTEIDGMLVQDKVANFYIGRTESIKQVGWDNRIKRLDHADFFTRAKGVLLSVYTDKFKVLHAQTPFNKIYMKKRNDYEADRRLIYAKYYSGSSNA